MSNKMIRSKPSKPTVLYKYKSVEKMDYIKEILIDHRMFLPTPSLFNDPLEGNYYNVKFAVAGSSMFDHQGYNHPYWHRELEKYRVLCLTPDCKNAQMWAHYACMYTGICIGFNTNTILDGISHVVYSKRRTPLTIEEPSDADFQEIVKNALMHKQYGWRYEDEWRLLIKSRVRYLHFASSDISHIVLGHRMDKKSKATIINMAQSQDIPVYTTRINEVGYSICITRIKDEDDDLVGLDDIKVKI